MASQQDRIHLLDDTLARAVPESRGWRRERSPTTSESLGEYWIEVRSPLRPTVQRLSVLLRHNGDIQVEYHIAENRGSPFEMLFPLAIGQETDAIESVSQFVADLLAEQLALGYAKGLFNGGRRFFGPGSLTESERHGFNWITSWLGTFDWPTTPD